MEDDSGAAAAPANGEDIVVRVGPSLKEGEGSDIQCSFRYEFQPASVDTSVCGLVSTDTSNAVVVEMAHAQAPGGIEFKGKLMENKDIDCVLIFDAQTNEFTIEKLPLACTQLRPQRKSSRATAVKRKTPI
ncbi:Aste57867_4347 [Aphanomyces stellatus]|uniref:Aste57867_4347 protein n=1 Tax=Aphanomyces stellatus TaxID=120398 RepID=A0A485KBA0_9STRA|nr:hypothetical protein As57867_004335 [Aphanomyces stellatus]VFT81461.1 Aste57867_4347 [Aphanomyces stellatus]